MKDTLFFFILSLVRFISSNVSDNSLWVWHTSIFCFILSPVTLCAFLFLSFSYTVSHLLSLLLLLLPSCHSSCPVSLVLLLACNIYSHCLTYSCSLPSLSHTHSFPLILSSFLHLSLCGSAVLCSPSCDTYHLTHSMLCAAGIAVMLAGTFIKLINKCSNDAHT